MVFVKFLSVFAEEFECAIFVVQPATENSNFVLLPESGGAFQGVGENQAFNFGARVLERHK